MHWRAPAHTVLHWSRLLTSLDTAITSVTAFALQTLSGCTRSKTTDFGAAAAAVVVGLRVEVVVALRVEAVAEAVTIVLLVDMVCRIALYTTRWLPCACGLSQNLL